MEKILKITVFQSACFDVEIPLADLGVTATPEYEWEIDKEILDWLLQNEEWDHTPYAQDIVGWEFRDPLD